MRTGLLFFFLVLCATAWAQEVTVGGQVILRLDSAEAAALVEKRIEAMLAQGAQPDKIVAKKDGSEFSVYWGEVRLVTATQALARANKSSSKSLALQWAKRLHQAVGPGLLRIEPGKAVLPVGEQVAIQLGGLATGEVTVSGANGFIDTRVESKTVFLKGRSAGKGQLVIKRGQGRAVLPFHVKDWAGFPPEKVELKVTGQPAPGRMVAEAGLQKLVAETRVNPGCRLQFDGGLPDVPSVPSGDQLRFHLPIKISGGESYYPVQRAIPVEVTCRDIPPVESNLLLVSNRPERVDQDGVLLEYEFSAKETCRLMYSHLNQTLADRNFWVNLENPGDQPVEVLIGWTYAGPNRNEVHTGHMAAIRFLDQLGKNAGYAVTLQPGQKFELAYHLMNRRDLISGFVNLHILEGRSLRVEVLSALAPSSNDSRGMARLGGPFNPFKIHPHGVFAQPWFEEWVDFTVGDAPVRVPFGKSPWLIDFETGLPNTGNFGVLYRYNFVVKNPTRQSRQFELIFHPTSGPAAGTFLVDGEVKEAGFRKKDVAATIHQFTVRPGQEKTVELVTFPEASSNYPAHVELVGL